MPNTHDYRQSARGWGHDYVFRPQDSGKRAHMMGWGFGIKKGDFILMSNPRSDNGETRYQIESVKYFSDPKDMWSAEVVHAPRNPPQEPNDPVQV